MKTMPAITQGLRALADFLEENPDLLAARWIPEQGTDVTFIVESRDGDLHTKTEIGFGSGVQYWGSSAYLNAITLIVVHIDGDES